MSVNRLGGDGGIFGRDLLLDELCASSRYESFEAIVSIMSDIFDSIEFGAMPAPSAPPLDQMVPEPSAPSVELLVDQEVLDLPNGFLLYQFYGIKTLDQLREKRNGELYHREFQYMSLAEYAMYTTSRQATVENLNEFTALDLNVSSNLLHKNCVRLPNLRFVKLHASSTFRRTEQQRNRITCGEFLTICPNLETLYIQSYSDYLALCPDTDLANEKLAMEFKRGIQIDTEYGWVTRADHIDRISSMKYFLSVEILRGLKSARALRRLLKDDVSVTVSRNDIPLIVMSGFDEARCFADGDYTKPIDKYLGASFDSERVKQETDSRLLRYKIKEALCHTELSPDLDRRGLSERTRLLIFEPSESCLRALLDLFPFSTSDFDYLIRNGATVHVVADPGSPQTVQWQLTKEHKAILLKFYGDRYREYNIGNQHLIEAIQTGLTICALTILEGEIDVEIRGQALRACVRHGHLAVARAMFERFDEFQLGPNDFSLIHECITSDKERWENDADRVEMLVLLLENGAPIRPQEPIQPSAMALLAHQCSKIPYSLQMAKTLLERDGNVKDRGEDGKSTYELCLVALAGLYTDYQSNTPSTPCPPLRLIQFLRAALFTKELELRVGWSTKGKERLSGNKSASFYQEKAISMMRKYDRGTWPSEFSEE